MIQSFRLACAFAVALLLCSASRLLGQSVDVAVRPATQTVNVGDPVDIEIRLNTNGRDVCMGGAFVQLDTAHLAFVAGTNNTATWNSTIFNVEPAQNHDPVLDVSYISLSVGANAAVSGNDLLVATLHFTATAPGTVALSLLFNAGREQTEFFDAGGDNPCTTPFTTNRIDGSVTIQGTAAVCIGDCDGGGSVTVDEVLTLVNIALNILDLSACPHGIGNAASVTIDIILQAVNNALGSCAPATS